MIKRAATTPLIFCFSTDPQSAAAAMTGLTIIDAFAADPSAAEKSSGPEWIKLAPRGAFTARDGRKFDTSPELLVERFNSDAVAVPIDLDHATVKKAMFGDAAPAIGWIEKLEARDDGLYGHVHWLEEGLRVLAARSHRYVSPALKADENGRAIWLHSAALVAAPGISMPAVASADPTHQETNMLKEIAQALGLSADASEASCLSAIASFQKRVDQEIHQEALDKLQSLSSELETRNKADHKAKVDTLLEGALKAKKISPAQRPGYEALCATDEGLAHVTKLIETFGAGLGASALDEKRDPGQLATLSAEDRDIMKMLGQTEEEYRKANGLTAS